MKLDAHGLFSAGLFALTVLVFVLDALVPELRKDDLFKMLAEAVVISGLINLAAGFYFGASRSQPPYAPPSPAPPPAPLDPPQ